MNTEVSRPFTLERILERSLIEGADPSGKTELDSFIEELNRRVAADRDVVSDEIATAIPDLVKKGARYLGAARQIIQRAGLGNRKIADAVERSLNTEIVLASVERRLQLSLMLMDLRRPRTISSLKKDSALRDGYIGEWLTLIAANENYADVQSAFETALHSGLISVGQVCIKAESIRRQFGDKLAEFFKAMARAVTSEADRSAITSAAAEMYGLDITSDVRRNKVRNRPVEKISPKTWMGSRTFSVLDVVRSEAQRRAVA